MQRMQKSGESTHAKNTRDSNLSRMPRMQIRSRKQSVGKNAKNGIVQSRMHAQNAKNAQGKNFENCQKCKHG